MLPPLDCSLNISEIIDLHVAHENYSAAYAFGDEAGRITEVSHFEFARAAHRVAHLLRPRRDGPDGQVVAIVALADVLVYQTIIAGCIIAGLVPVQISHRNSTAAIVHLLSDTGSRRLLTTKASLGHLVDLVSVDLSAMDPPYHLSVEEIPLLGQLYPHLGQETLKDPFAPYPSPSTRTALDNVAIYLHSSGSTGLPKCIPETHRTLIHFAALGALTDMIEISPRQAIGALPPAHGFATATEYIIPPSPTAENAMENAKRANATGIMTVPSMILDWQSPEDIAYLKTLNIAYGGGPLASRVGDSLFNQGVNIVPLYAGTEIGPVTLMKRRLDEIAAGEWAWFRFSSRANIRWEPQGDGSFECQCLTVPETHQVSVENLSDVKGFSTKDLFERHPTKSDLYKIVGRLDDVLIMANGEKAVPGPMEDIIMASPFIVCAVMFGRERSQVGVLVEPHQQYQIDSTDEQQVVKFRNLIWPVIEQANESTPAFARIYKEMVLVTQPARPMVRTTKGTVIKKATIALYEQEIEVLYNTIRASGNAASETEPPLSWSPQDIQPWITAHANLVAGRNIRSGRDLFDQGFDSLNATFLRHRIVGALRNSDHTAAAQNIGQNFIYSHPTVEELADAIAALIHGDTDVCDDAKAIVERMITKYTAGFETTDFHKKNVASSKGTVVLLTGSTGGLGSHLLELLLSLPSVQRVYAFNRGTRIPLAERQREAFVNRELDVTLLSSEKLSYLEGESVQEDLGLPLDVWAVLRDTISVIIHNAWTLDFNKSLTSFEPHVKGMRNLIDLARQSPNEFGVRFLFTSSVGSALGWDPKLGPFPEELQLDADVAVGNGYGESKYISERILAASGLDATSFRIGQLCGSTTNGAWTTSDWVPAMVKSSIALGTFPSDPSGVAAWLPPSVVSRTIVDAALSVEKPPFAVNLVHPRPVSWDFVVSIMARTVQLPLTPLADWVQKVQDGASRATAEDVSNIPGIKLLDFFTATAAKAGTIEFSTLKAQALSKSMELLNPLNEDDVNQWMQYWREKGFIR
ncbi:hypothetical protein K438DRAFT_1954309 [Mycena galopus ATCC 62051]|nr:hypothetical protein K438DRAFT_1954309 [Mycena galopus ATCC 62051]